MGPTPIPTPTPTYGDRSELAPSMPDENAPARRSKGRTTPDHPRTDAVVDPASLKPAPRQDR